MNRHDNGGNRHDDSDLPQDPALQALYRQLPAEQPPAALDEVILAAARRAAGSKPRALPLLQRWRIPLAAAASILLSVLVLRHTVVTPGTGDSLAGSVDRFDVGEPLAGAVPRVGQLPSSAQPAPAPAETSAPFERAPKAVVADTAAGAVPAKKVAAGPAQGNLAATAEPRVVAADLAADMAAERDHAVAAAVASAPPAAHAEAETGDAMAARSNRALAEYADGAARETRKEALAAAPVPVPASRPGSWPFGLLPTLSPEIACARLIQDAGGSCSGRTDGGALVLRLTGADRDWPTRLREALAGLGWQEQGALTRGDSGSYRRTTERGIDSIDWQALAGAGAPAMVLTLRQAPAPGR